MTILLNTGRVESFGEVEFFSFLCSAVSYQVHYMRDNTTCCAEIQFNFSRLFFFFNGQCMKCCSTVSLKRMSRTDLNPWKIQNYSLQGLHI